MSFISKEEQLKKWYDRLSGNAGTGARGVDVLDRMNYVTDDDYIDACAKYDLEHSSPAFAAARAAAEQEYRRRNKCADEKAATERVKAAYAANLKEVEATDLDKRTAAKEARRRAYDDLYAGRIDAQDVGQKINDYYESAVEDAKKGHASAKTFNDLMRATWRGENS